MNELKITLKLPGYEDLLAGTISRLGYPGPEAVTANISAHIGDGIDMCCKLARPEVTCRSTPFTDLEKTAIYGENLCLETVNWTRLAARMSGIREICCFAVTLGGTIDDRINGLGKTAMVQALMLDAAASVLADLYADNIQQQLSQHYLHQGLQSSVRFSPGYCDWPMKEGQKALIPFLQPASIGISASDSGLMSPRKSVTAAIIAADQIPTKSPCFLCARDCPHRRETYANNGRKKDVRDVADD